MITKQLSNYKVLLATSRISFVLKQLHHLLIKMNVSWLPNNGLRKAYKNKVLNQIIYYSLFRLKLVKLLEHLKDGNVLVWERRRRGHSCGGHNIVSTGESVVPFSHCSNRRLCIHSNYSLSVHSCWHSRFCSFSQAFTKPFLIHTSFLFI